MKSKSKNVKKVEFRLPESLINICTDIRDKNIPMPERILIVALSNEDHIIHYYHNMNNLEVLGLMDATKHLVLTGSSKLRKE